MPAFRRRALCASPLPAHVVTLVRSETTYPLCRAVPGLSHFKFDEETAASSHEYRYGYRYRYRYLYLTYRQYIIISSSRAYTGTGTGTCITSVLRKQSAQIFMCVFPCFSVLCLCLSFCRCFPSSSALGFHQLYWIRYYKCDIFVWKKERLGVYTGDKDRDTSLTTAHG
jgi:hypothetical protein